MSTSTKVLLVTLACIAALTAGKLLQAPLPTGIDGIYAGRNDGSTHYFLTAASPFHSSVSLAVMTLHKSGWTLDTFKPDMFNDFDPNDHCTVLTNTSLVFKTANKIWFVDRKTLKITQTVSPAGACAYDEVNGRFILLGYGVIDYYTVDVASAEVKHHQATQSFMNVKAAVVSSSGKTVVFLTNCDMQNCNRTHLDVSKGTVTDMGVLPFGSISEIHSLREGSNYYFVTNDCGVHAVTVETPSQVQSIKLERSSATGCTAPRVFNSTLLFGTGFFSTRVHTVDLEKFAFGDMIELAPYADSPSLSWMGHSLVNGVLVAITAAANTRPGGAELFLIDYARFGVLGEPYATTPTAREFISAYSHGKEGSAILVAATSPPQVVAAHLGKKATVDAVAPLDITKLARVGVTAFDQRRGVLYLAGWRGAASFNVQSGKAVYTELPERRHERFQPSTMTVSADGKQLYIIGWDTRRAFVLDTASMNVTETIDLEEPEEDDTAVSSLARVLSKDDAYVIAQWIFHSSDTTPVRSLVACATTEQPIVGKSVDLPAPPLITTIPGDVQDAKLGVLNQQRRLVFVDFTTCPPTVRGSSTLRNETEKPIDGVVVDAAHSRAFALIPTEPILQFDLKTMESIKLSEGMPDASVGVALPDGTLVQAGFQPVVAFITFDETEEAE